MTERIHKGWWYRRRKKSQPGFLWQFALRCLGFFLAAFSFAMFDGFRKEVLISDQWYLKKAGRLVRVLPYPTTTEGRFLEAWVCSRRSWDVDLDHGMHPSC